MRVFLIGISCLTWIPVMLVSAAEDKAASAPGAQGGQKAPRPPKPGVKTPGVQIPMHALKPEAAYDVPGSPDWQALNDTVLYVSNKPKDSVSKLDSKTKKVAAVITVGRKPCSGLTTGFGSLWVPNCGDQ